MRLVMRPLQKQIFSAFLAAIALVCMMTLGIRLIPAASYLKYEPSGAVILLCGLLMGPAAGFECALVKNVLYFLIHGGNPYGHLSDFLMTSVFTLVVTGLLYGNAALTNAASAKAAASGSASAKAAPANAAPSGIREIICCAAGCAAAVLFAIPMNYVILRLQFGMAPAAVTASLVYIIPFNLLKTVLNSVAALLLHRPVRTAITGIIRNGG